MGFFRRLAAGLMMFALLVGLAAPVQAASPGIAVTALPAYYGFTNTVTLTNQGSADALDVVANVVLLAPQTPYAHVTLTGESVSPASTFRDQFGNVVGQFNWPVLKPKQSVTLTLHYQATSSDISYRLPASYPPYNTQSALYKFYTNPALEHTDGVDTGAPQIRQLDAAVTRGIGSPYLRAQALFQWIVHNIHYNYSLQASGSAVRTLATHLGICSDFADLYVSMLRTDGIPARLVGGYVTNNGGNQGGFHQWTEFYLPSVGWVVADPTWGQYGYFASLEDDWHIPLYDGIRPDISVHWQFSSASSGRPQLAIHYHYHFVTEQSPSAAKSVKLPILSVSPPVTMHHVALNPWASLWIHWQHVLIDTAIQILHSLEALVSRITAHSGARQGA
ncbi:MAG: transglutaminase domain-containing protein [Thermaerobacter sp.]|nr:transglutaminase domain-containing protein [Thermaerobacter sp.]